jgi:hypothetical protein
VGAATGTLAGGVLGAIAGLLVGIGALAIPHRPRCGRVKYQFAFGQQLDRDRQLGANDLGIR